MPWSELSMGVSGTRKNPRHEGEMKLNLQVFQKVMGWMCSEIRVLQVPFCGAGHGRISGHLVAAKRNFF